jgi:4-hydroxy-tetrahydrodipicolinate reductase
MAMKLAIAGAGGRMGRVLTRVVHETEGCEIAGAIEARGSPYAGADVGTLAGIAALGVPITDDPLPLFTFIDGLLDFTVP